MRRHLTLPRPRLDSSEATKPPFAGERAMPPTSIVANDCKAGGTFPWADGHGPTGASDWPDRSEPDDGGGDPFGFFGIVRDHQDGDAGPVTHRHQRIEYFAPPRAVERR